MPPPPSPSRPPVQPSARRRHLTAEERAAIARERAQGVRVQEFARRWSVSQPDAVRRLMALAEAAQLAPVAAPVREAGVHVNRIAQACNEARMWSQPIPYTAEDHAHVCQAVVVVFEVVS